VILFDEIEKSHPRILDKFLQILEDGRLTDGRGNTVYFSEAVIVFTSNLGIYVDRTIRQGESFVIARELNVEPNTPFAEVQERVRKAIEEHFKLRLNRPELLNRIGDNIVVFDFIRRDVGQQIFEKMLTNIWRRISEEHSVQVELSREAKQTLQELCLSDLSNGGRGIGNQLEACLVNPLSRVLFERAPESRDRLKVREILHENGIYRLALG
jgi:ATP-dependent Clp protease ATP-binding subunit ClpA